MSFKHDSESLKKIYDEILFDFFQKNTMPTFVHFDSNDASLYSYYYKDTYIYLYDSPLLRRIRIISNSEITFLAFHYPLFHKSYIINANESLFPKERSSRFISWLEQAKF